MYNYAIYLQLIGLLCSVYKPILMFSSALLVMMCSLVIIKKVIYPRR